MEVQRKREGKMKIRAEQVKKQVETFIREQGLLAAGDRILVAVSGGADSVCLLHLLAKLRKSWGWQLRAVHVNHQLRPGEAQRDEAFVKAYCIKYSVEYCCQSVDVKGLVCARGLSEEEAGRNLRYQVFEEEARRWEQEDGTGKVDLVKIAVAHHRDDQAETVLFHLFRGSGLKGLGGIPAVRGRVIRPLLSVGREEILSYLKEEGLEFCQDSTNFSEEYTRNRIRQEILPAIEAAVNERAADHIVQAAQKMRQADLYLASQAERWLKKYGVQEEDKKSNGFMGEGGKQLLQRGTDGKPFLCAEADGKSLLRAGADVKLLVKEEEIFQTYIIRQMMAWLSGAAKDVTNAHVEAVRSLLGKSVGKQVDLPYGLRARRSYDKLWLEKTGKPEEKGEIFLPELEIKEFSYEKGMEIPQNQYTKWLDCDKIKGALSVRTRQTGDYFFLPGGGRKSIKAYMVDEKIPASLRKRIPLLADGNHILWIIGRRISEGCKVTDETKRVLQVHVREADGNLQGFGCQD